MGPNVQTHEPMVCMGGGALHVQITILTVPLLPKSSRGWQPSLKYKPLGSDLNLGRREFWLRLWLVSSAEQCIALQVMVNCFSIDHILALLALHFPSSPSILELLSWQISVHQDNRLLTIYLPMKLFKSTNIWLTHHLSNPPCLTLEQNDKMCQAPPHRTYTSLAYSANCSLHFKKNS